jgi:hypothetical protein
MNRSSDSQHAADSPEALRDIAEENLRFAMYDHQEMIRGADLKAEVLGIFPTAVLPTVAWQGEISTSTLGGWLGIVATLSALVAFFCVGAVLWPRSDPRRDVPLGDYTPSRVLYPPLQPGPGQTVSDHTRRALHTDWPHELMYELWKISRIRSTKQKWFRCALVASGGSVVAVAARLIMH